jgi:predicted extracellular nuclease
MSVIRNIQRIFFLIAFTILLNILSYGQKTVPGDSMKFFRIVFYNVENLFDTINDPGIKDGAYAPESKMQWNSEKYNLKISHISDVLAAIGENDLPSVIGLSEVENESVIEDLIHTKKLASGRYEVIHKESTDRRGIDNAFLYRKDSFVVLSYGFIHISFPQDTGSETRDIIFVKGIPKGCHDTLNIFVNHWPSRSSAKNSESKRIYTASVLRQQVDSLFQKNMRANIILIGDFNDQPLNNSLKNTLNAQYMVGDAKAGNLYNLMFPPFYRGEGTVYHNGWEVFDQVIISGSLVRKPRGAVLRTHEGKIFKPDWLLRKNKDGIMVPYRTESNNIYYGGYSDHLPVYIDLLIP